MTDVPRARPKPRPSRRSRQSRDAADADLRGQPWRAFSLPMALSTPPTSLASRALACLVLACASPRPVSGTTQLGGLAADELVLQLSQACSLLPGGAPMGRPNGVRMHRLLPGEYRPILEDEGGVYFASPSGIVITEPALKGTHAEPGGIYVPLNPKLEAYEYLGDADGISTRQRLPGHCRFELRRAETAASNPG